MRTTVSGTTKLEFEENEYKFASILTIAFLFSEFLAFDFERKLSVLGIDGSGVALIDF